MEEKTPSPNSTKGDGIAQMVISVLWMAYECNYLYLYYIRGGIFIYRKPDSIIVLNLLFAIMGLILGYKTIKGKLKIRTGYLAIISAWITTLFIEKFV